MTDDKIKDTVVQHCAELARKVVADALRGNRIAPKRGYKRRTDEQIAHLVYNSLVALKSQKNRAALIEEGK